MSSQDQNQPKRPWRALLWISLGVSFLCAALIALSCTPSAPKKYISKGEIDDARQAALKILTRQPELKSHLAPLEQCSAAVRQLNNHFHRHPDQLPRPYDEKEGQRLRNEFGLDKDELDEVNSRSFTPLDAHYLDACFLLRDAARSLEIADLPPLERADTAFAWVVRQVRLQERPGDILPPAFVARRGWGTSMERSLLFLELLRQVDVDACLIACSEVNKDVRAMHWLAGVLAGKDIYLFDSRLGLPLPGPDEGSIATLAQAQSQPEVLAQLTVDPSAPYDVTSEQLKKAELYVASPLSALAPRMKHLEELMHGRGNVHLAVDVYALMQKFRDAARSPNVPVRFANRADAPSTPLRSLRQFLAPEAGGNDSLRALSLKDNLQGFANPEDNQQLQLYRRQFFDYDMVPWRDLPARIRGMPCNFELGILPRNVFTNTYLTIYRGQRELILRGQFEEATNMLVLYRDLFDQYQRARDGLPENDEEIARWCDNAMNVELFLIRARAAKSAKPETPTELDLAKKAVAELRKNCEQRFAALNFPRALAGSLGERTVYHLALSKHEYAERLQARLRRPGQTQNETGESAAQEAWRSAADWWSTYLQDYEAALAAASARTLLAQCLEGARDRDGAVMALENLSGSLTPLEKTARLYRARQLKQ